MEGIKEFNHLNEVKEFVKENKKVVTIVKPKGGCPICERYAPVVMKAISEIKKDYPDMIFTILWYEENDECIEELDICSPTMIFYLNGEIKKKKPVETFSIDNLKEELEEILKEVYG